MELKSFSICGEGCLLASGHKGQRKMPFTYPEVVDLSQQADIVRCGDLDIGWADVESLGILFQLPRTIDYSFDLFRIIIAESAEVKFHCAIVIISALITGLVIEPVSWLFRKDVSHNLVFGRELKRV